MISTSTSRRSSGSLVKVSIVIPAVDPTPVLKNAVPPREFHRVEELSTALGEALGVAVPIVEGRLADAPKAGYLIMFGVPRDIDPTLGSRIVAFDEDRSSIMKNVEALNLAAAVEKQRYVAWRMGRTDERRIGVVGRKDVAEHMGARVLSGPYTSARYAGLADDAPGDLIALLADYLRAYAQVVAYDSRSP